jgi:hypothetical protein
MPRSNLQIPGSNVAPPSTPGKPIVADFPTPNLADRIKFVSRDARLAEHAEPPEKGSKFDGPEAGKMDGWVFATRRPADQVGWVQDFYLNERENQDAYNFSVDYPYPTTDAPRVNRTYVYLREDFADLTPPDLSAVDTAFPQLRLVDYKQIRLEDPVLDSLFIGVQKVFEPRPIAFTDQETSEAFGFGGVMDRETTIDLPGSNPVEEGINVVESKTTKKGLNTQTRETLKLAGGDSPYIEVTNGGSGYSTAPLVSFTGQVANVGGGVAHAVINHVGAGSTEYTYGANRASSGDENGVFTFIGKLLGGGTWQNPTNTTDGVIIGLVSGTSLVEGTLPMITDHAPSNIDTNKTSHPAFLIDIGAGRKLALDTVDFRQWSGAEDDSGTVNINIAGSNDNSNWTLLGALTLTKKPNKWFSTAINSDHTYRYFRIKASDSANRHITLGELEFYGTLTYQIFGVAGTSQVQQIVVDTPGTYVTPPHIALTGGGGTGATAKATLNGGGGIASIAVTNPGFGYGSAPTVVITGGTGAQADALAILGFGVDSVTLDNAGAGYTSPPTVHFDGDGSGAAAVAVLGGGIESINVDNPGSAYDTAPTVAFTGGGGGTGAAATAVLGFGVDHGTITNGGSGFTSTPDIDVTGDGTGASFAAFLGLPIESVILDDAGSGYSASFVVTFVGDGSGADALAVVGFGLSSIAVDAPGSGYLTPPTVVITGDGTGATATAVLTGDTVTSIVVNTPGSGYTTIPTISFSGGSGTGAAATATLLPTGPVLRIDLTNAGSGYTEAPTLDVSAGDGTGAAGTAVLDTSVPGVVGRIELLSAGVGYTTPPTIAITGGGGTGATADAVLDTLGIVIDITLTAAGTGFAFAPDITLTPTGTGGGAAASAVMGASDGIVAINVTSSGSGYTTAPTVVIEGDGTGATATAVLNATGSVVRVALLVIGEYEDAPHVFFTGGGGTGAAATYHLASAWATLHETETDPVEKIVLQITKKIVPAGTEYSGDGWMDIKSIDKWRSIQLVTKVDLTRLPPPETVPGSHKLDLPDELIGVEVNFENQRKLGWRLNTGFKSSDVSVSVSGAVRVIRRNGFSGMATSRVTRQFFFGIPPEAQLPCPTLILPTSGNVILTSTGGSVSAAGGTTGGFIYLQAEQSDFTQVQIVPVNNVLTGALSKKPVKSPVITVRGDVGSVWTDSPTSLFLPSPSALGMDTTSPTPVFSQSIGQCTLTTDIPASNPVILTPGNSILQAVEVEKWRFGLYVLTTIYVIIPDASCVPFVPAPDVPDEPPAIPIAWWPFEAEV